MKDGEAVPRQPPAAAVQAAGEAFRHWRQGDPASGGYIIPYRYAARVQPAAAPAWLLAALRRALPDMCRWLDAARQLGGALGRFDRARASDPHGPRFDQDWFSGLDATLAYTAVRELRPALLVEVGSGHSTRFLARAARDGATGTRLVSIDPQPRRDIDALCTEVHRVPLDTAALPLFDALGEGDVLFLDGSHVLMPGTDVDLVLNHVLPRLPDGCMLHVHDIFLPDDYPPQWHWRGYNEQAALGALIGSGRLRIIAASAWLRREHAGLLHGVHAPCPPGALESSMWLRVCGPAADAV